MCFPALPMIAAGISAVGSVVSGITGMQSANAQARAQQRQAGMERQRGAYEAGRQTDINNRRLAGMRSAYLNSGIALSGSALDVIEDSATEASLDEQAIRYGAQVRSDNLMFESQISRMNGRNAMIGGVFGALGSVVNGLSQQRQQSQNRTMVRNPYAF